MGAKPWDILKGAVPDDVAKKRMNTCRRCEFLIPVTHQCSKCLCFMKAKTKIKNASCPIGKWGKYSG